MSTVGDSGNTMPAGACWRRFVWCRALFAGLIVAVVPSIVLAQAGNAPDLDQMRKGNLGAADREALQGWIDGRMQALLAAEAPREIGVVLFFDRETGLVRHYEAADATDAFRAGVAELVTAAFAREYQAARTAGGGPAPLAVVYPLTALRIFGQTSALPAFRAALDDPTGAARMLAAQGVWVLRDNLPEADWNAVRGEVQQAAIRETHNAALSWMYRALAVPQGQRAGQSVQTILSVLEDRLQRIANRTDLPRAADGVAIDFLGGRFQNITDTARRTEIARRIAELMTHAVYAYLDRDPNLVQREWLERVVLRAEQQLTAIAGNVYQGRRTPNVTRALFSGGEDKAERTLQELVKWIGNDQAEGLLNAAPLSLPRGLGIQR